MFSGSPRRSQSGNHITGSLANLKRIPPENLSRRTRHNDMNGRTCCLIAFLGWFVLFLAAWPVVDGHQQSCFGDSSLIGVKSVNAANLQCCDKRGFCYGYSTRSVEAKLGAQLIENLPKVALDSSNNRPKRYANLDTADEITSNSLLEGEYSNETACCASNISIFFPTSGVSATSMKRVPVLQIEPFKQSVIYNRCLEKECRILRGICTQVYLPQLLYILALDEEGNLTTRLDFILVESGCQCQTNWNDQTYRVSPAVGLDPLSIYELNHVLGIDVSFSNIPFVTTFSLMDNQSLSGSPPIPSQSTMQYLIANVSSEVPVTTKSPNSTIPLNNSDMTSTPTPTPTSSSAAVEQLLPPLPRPGSPIHLKGFHDPVLLAIGKYVEL